ncbi:hypothetical protein B0H16DRAFT_1463984 [Mycena metata]|uniref:F-box domain-containing protein n=1 Tax=Mycena metata TaxID=1033252 RepID=A0AAD7IGD4_9AGAR|nr:hypothetical protein B0H16DRAFT_1463984 [Mycena metata]
MGLSYFIVRHTTYLAVEHNSIHGTRKAPRFGPRRLAGPTTFSATARRIDFGTQGRTEVMPWRDAASSPTSHLVSPAIASRTSFLDLPITVLIGSFPMFYRTQKLRASLAELEVSVARQRTLLRDLEQQQQLLQSTLDDLVFPILRLPLEITAEIFLHCVSDTAAASPDPSIAPFLFLRVCRIWRAIALSIPTLWANLYLDFDHFSRSIFTADYVDQFIESHFIRACARPLALSIRGWIVDESIFPRLDSLIRRYADRFHSLEVLVEKHDFSFYAESFPSLEKITIGFPDDGAPALSVWNRIAMFAGAPRLREARLVDGANLSVVSLPWHQLTTFTGQCFEADECLDLLRLAPSLVECTLSVAADSAPSTTSPVVHRRMQIFRLVCENDEASNNGNILAKIRLPTLHSLYLVHIAGLQQVGHQAFTTFLSHASSLRKFSFSCSEAARFPIDWFDMMRRLTDIEFINPEVRFMGKFIRRLDRCNPTAPPPFLPYLKNLTFRAYSHPIHQDLIRVLSSQLTAAHGPVRLKSVRFEWAKGNSWKLDENITAPLERHIARGIDIYMVLSYAPTAGDERDFTALIYNNIRIVFDLPLWPVRDESSITSQTLEKALLKFYHFVHWRISLQIAVAQRLGRILQGGRLDIGSPSPDLDTSCNAPRNRSGFLRVRRSSGKTKIL